MKFISNMAIKQKETVQIKGTRTLLVLNKTNQEGKVFENVTIQSYRKGSTSIIIIKDETRKENLQRQKVIGMFFGVNASPVSSVHFIAKAGYMGDEVVIALFRPNGIVINEYGNYFKLTENCWEMLGKSKEK